jgi:hypothetical protein
MQGPKATRLSVIGGRVLETGDCGIVLDSQKKWCMHSKRGKRKSVETLVFTQWDSHLALIMPVYTWYQL